jgi:hypothetical protein
MPRRAIYNVAWRAAPWISRAPVLRDALEAWAVKLVGETPVSLTLRHARA